MGHGPRGRFGKCPPGSRCWRDCGHHAAREPQSIFLQPVDSELTVNSKAIAFFIIGVGIVVLIASSAIGGDTDDDFRGFSGRQAEVHMMAIPLVPALIGVSASLLPLVEPDIRTEDRNLVCDAATELESAADDYSNQDYCVFIGQFAPADNGRCDGKNVHDCIGDFPSTEAPPPIIEDVMDRTAPTPSAGGHMFLRAKNPVISI